MEHKAAKPIRIIIADDHQLFAEGLENLLASTGKYNIVAKVNNGKKLLQVLNSQTAELILLDINMPHLPGTETALLIRKVNATQKIVFVTMYYDTRITQFCKTNSINGYLLKDSTATEMKSALERIMGGEMVHTYKAVSKVPLNDVAFEDSFVNKLKISKRELEIIELVKHGYSSKEIAARLFLSEFTIETHRKNIFRKLGVSSVAGLLQFVHEHRL